MMAVMAPTEQVYESLLTIYSNQLICECESLSIPLRNLLTLDFSLHQICSSNYVDQTFWNQFNAINKTLSFVDFASDGGAYFMTMKTFCDLARTTITIVKESFETIEYINRYLISRQQFEQQMKSYIDAFISQTEDDFIRSISYFRDLTSRNNMLSTSALLRKLYISRDFTVRSGSGGDSLNKACVISSDYSRPSLFAKFVSQTTYISEWEIPGIAFGCSMIDSLMQSTFECWYNESCIQNFSYYTSQRLYVPFRAPKMLNLSMTKFDLKTKISSIVYKLMVEEWYSSTNYTAFFSICAPKSCNYTAMVRDDRSTVLGNIVGIYGGLKRILNVFIPLLAYLVYKMYLYCYHRHQANHSDNNKQSKHLIFVA